MDLLQQHYQNMEQKCEKQGLNHALIEARTSEAAELEKQGLNHALTEARTSEAAKLQNRVNG